MIENIYTFPAFSGPSRVLQFDAAKCVGCNRCVNVCPIDVMIPNPEKGKEPIVIFAEECWFCGSCVNDCPHQAVTLVMPAKQRISAVWKEKATGKEYRVGMKDPLPPNTRPAAGETGKEN